jgi:predicted GIY-YIG superfamily endonuclease
MPKLPIDHSNTTIYKLVHKEDYDNANIYIGSTTDFIRRKNKHKSDCNCVTSKSYNDKKYQYIRGNGGWEEWNMIEVEKFSCNDKREAEAREEYWRCHFNSQLNTKRAYRTVEQRNQYDIEYQKQFYLDNKGKKLEYQKTYYYNKKNKTDSSSDDSTECITH